MPAASLRSDKAFTVGDQSYDYLQYTFVTEMISFNDTTLAHKHTQRNVIENLVFIAWWNTMSLHLNHSLKEMYISSLRHDL